MILSVSDYRLFIIILVISVSAKTGSCQTIITIAGNGTAGFSGDGGPATNAEFYTPSGVAADKQGNIYLADDVNNVIHKIDSNGFLSRFAGSGSSGLAGDGGPATNAELELALGNVGMSIDSLGNLLFSDGSRVRRIDHAGIITTVVGNGVTGNSGDGGPATNAELGSPSGICFNKKGELLIADDYNNNIRSVGIDGMISTIAGTTLGFSGDGGPATNAQMKLPEGISVDDSGNIFIADFYNGRIRKITSSGIIATVAGGSTMGVVGCEGCLATDLAIDAPIGVAIDAQGSVFFSNAGYARIQKVTKDGLAYSVAGNGIDGFSGDGGLAKLAELHNPNMICFDRNGNLLLADKGNNRFRKIQFSGSSPVLLCTSTQCFSLSPNPTSGSFTLTLPQTTGSCGITVYDVLGKVITTSTINGPGPVQFHLAAPPGTYIVQVVSAWAVWRQKLEVW